jgi:hypothetical protein
LVLGAGATTIAVKRRGVDAHAREAVWLAGLIVVGLFAAIYAVSNIVGVVFPCLTRWTWVLGVAMGILVLQGLWFAIPTARRATVLRFTAPGAAILLAVLAAIASIEAIDAGTPFGNNQAQEHELTREVLAQLPPGDGPVLINAFQGGTVAPGIALQLERRGIPVELSPSLPVIYGEHRSESGPPYRAKLVVVLGDEAIAKFDPPGPRIAHFSKPLQAEDRRAIRNILKEAERTPPGAGRDALLELARNGRRGPAIEIAVYLDERPERE